MGLYLSDDHASSVAELWDGGPVTALAFSSDGQRLMFGSKRLYRLDLADRIASEVALPVLAPDEVLTYLSINPASPGEMVVSTSHLNVFLLASASGDGSKPVEWQRILRSGSSE